MDRCTASHASFDVMRVTSVHNPVNEILSGEAPFSPPRLEMFVVRPLTTAQQNGHWAITAIAQMRRGEPLRTSVGPSNCSFAGICVKWRVYTDTRHRGQNRTRGNRPSGIAGGPAETWTMVDAKRARKAETPKQPSLCLRLRAPQFYPDKAGLAGRGGSWGAARTHPL